MSSAPSRARKRGCSGGRRRGALCLAGRTTARPRAAPQPLPARIECTPGQDAARARPRGNPPLHASLLSRARPDVRHRHHPRRSRPPRPASNRCRTRGALGRPCRRQHPSRRSARRIRERDRAARGRAPTRPRPPQPVPRPLQPNPHLTTVWPLNPRARAQAPRPGREAERPLLAQPGQPRPPAHTRRPAHQAASVRERARRDPHRLRTHARRGARPARAHRAPLPRTRSACRSARPADPARRTARPRVLLARGRAAVRAARRRTRLACELLPALPPTRRNDRADAADRPRRRARLPPHTAARAAAEERVRGPLTIACTLHVPDELMQALAEEVAARVAPTMSARRPVSPWLDFGGAREDLRFSRDQLYKLTAAKAIPFRKKRGGQGLLFHRGELDRWVHAAYEPTGCSREVELWSSTSQ